MRHLILVPLLLLSLAACGGKIPPTHHYSLDASLSAPALSQATTTYPVSIAVARFQASRALSQDRLVFREPPNKLDFYEYHRWVDAPPDMVTRNLIKQLLSSGLFRSVTSNQGGAPADYILRGTLENLEEVDSGESVTGRVALAAELLDAKTRAVVWTGRGSHEASVGQRSVEGIVAALNDGVRQSIDQIARGLAAYFQQRPAQ